MSCAIRERSRSTACAAPVFSSRRRIRRRVSNRRGAASAPWPVAQQPEPHGLPEIRSTSNFMLAPVLFHTRSCCTQSLGMNIFRRGCNCRWSPAWCDIRPVGLKIFQPAFERTFPARQSSSRCIQIRCGAARWNFQRPGIVAVREFFVVHAHRFDPNWWRQRVDFCATGSTATMPSPWKQEPAIRRFATADWSLPEHSRVGKPSLMP